MYGHNGREYETDKINRNNLYSKEDEEEEEHVKVNTTVWVRQYPFKEELKLNFEFLFWKKRSWRKRMFEVFFSFTLSFFNI